MKFLPLTFRNLMRRPIRTILVFLATTVAFLLFGILMILKVAFSMGVEMAGADRLMMLNKMGFIQPIPISYIEKIRAVPGVKLVTHASWMGGIYQDPNNNVFQFAVEPDTYMAMYPEFKLPPEQMKAWLSDKQGFIAGKDLADRFGWKIGQKIPIQGTFNRPKSGDGVTWEFNLVGIYDGEPEIDKTQFLFRWDYLDENRTLGLRRLGPDQSGRSRAGRRNREAGRRDVREFFERNEDRHRRGHGAELRESGRKHRGDCHGHLGRGALHGPADCGESDVPCGARAHQ
jgi:putative ABC transport system permease protein